MGRTENHFVHKLRMLHYKINFSIKIHGQIFCSKRFLYLGSTFGKPAAWFFGYFFHCNSQ